MSDGQRIQVETVLVTGLLAILGTVAGGLIKGCMDNSLADKKFQTDLVMKALEPEKQEERINSLRFLIETSLVSDPDICNGVRSYLARKPKNVPQFRAATLAPSPGVVVPSTAETRGFTDFTVFVCDKEWGNEAAQIAARSLIDSMKADGRVGQITLRSWSSYNEVPVEALRNKLTLIVDRGSGEEREIPRLEQLFRAKGHQDIKIVDNPGEPTRWLVSIVLCPSP